MRRSEALKIRAALEMAAARFEDGEALNAPFLFPLWRTGVQYKTGDRCRFESLLYKCLMNHTSQSDWTPKAAPSLFARVSEPEILFPEWIKPTGAHDAYGMGDKVSYGGKHFVSELYSNVYEPGVYGWREV